MIGEIRNSSGERLDVAHHAGSRTGILVVFGHGVTGDKDRPLLVALAAGLSHRGWPCLRISFSGNGESEGDFQSSTISKEVEDLKSVLSAIPDETLIFYIGHSMGAAVGVLTAAGDKRIRGLVSLAGMTHTAEFVRREFGDVVPDEGYMWDEPDCPLSRRYVDDLNAIVDTLDAAARVSCPWLLVHGTEDDVVPLKDGMDAYSAASCTKEWLEVEGAGHSFGEESYETIIMRLDAWLESNVVEGS